MTRAAVLIGVNRTGGLPVLADAVAGARRMERWALDQGMRRDRVLVFTDEAGPVDIGDVRRAVRALVDGGAVEQLVVYFAGHGVNIRYGEYWLLSDAPVDASAAVNVEGSVVLARRSGIAHVVFISDACRTAAEGVQAQGVTGGEIFPNDPVPGPERPVDLFFATTLGRPALEIRDPHATAAAYRAVYTDALLDAFGGRLPAAALPSDDGGRRVYWVRPRRLKACLAEEFPRRLVRLGVGPTVSQEPDARITSDDDAWLARLASLDAPPAAGVTRGGFRGGTPREAIRDAARDAGVDMDADADMDADVDVDAPAAPAAATPGSRARARLDALLAGDRSGGLAVAGARRGAASRGGAVARGSAAASPAPAAPVPAAASCGFRVEGARIAEALCADAGVEVSADSSGALVWPGAGRPAADVLLVLDDGSAVLLPALRGFVAALAFDDGELADVAYEPSGDSPRRRPSARRAGELRALRAVVADAARHGVFRIEGGQAPALAERIRQAAQVDPALALYAAYAFHDLQQTGRIRDMARALEDDLGVALFDLDLLSGAFARPGAGAPRHPPLPLLAQGWALLGALGANDRPGALAAIELRALQRELLPSLWSHFNAAGARRLRDLVSSPGRSP